MCKMFQPGKLPLVLKAQFFFMALTVFMGFSLPIWPANTNDYEDFSTTTPVNWSNNGAIGGYATDWNNTRGNADYGVVYGRAGVLKDTTNNANMIKVLSNSGGNSRLSFQSDQVTITADTAGQGSGVVTRVTNYLGLSLGRMAVYAGSSLQATPQKPIGWQILRYASRLDSHDDVSNAESHRHANRMSFYVFDSSQAGAVFGTTSASFTNAVSLFEDYRAQRPSPADPYSQWGSYTTASNFFTLSSATRPDGSTFDTSGQPLSWKYDDVCDAGGVGCALGTSVNNNVIGLRIINDGTNFYFYINPDADDNDATRPNEYLLLGQSPATFTSNLSAMVGVESERYDTEMQWAEFDNFLIKSVADSSVANTMSEISPNSATVGSTTNFKLIINPTINNVSGSRPADAGIAEIRIKKPSAFSAWDTSSVTVYSDYGAGAAHPDIATINAMTIANAGTSCTWSAVASGEARVCANGSDLIIRFRAVSSADNNVITTSTADKRIAVHFSQTMPGSPNITGDEYQVFIGNEKYNLSHTDNTTGNNGLAYATTGWQKVLAGDAQGAFGNSTLVVKTVDVPQGYSSIVPAVVYVGSPQQLQNFVSGTSNPNNTNIDKIEVEIYKQLYQTGGGTCTGGGIAANNPDCYIDDTITNLTSDWGITGTGFATSLLDSSLTSSLTGGNTKAVLDYSSGQYIPGEGGLDKLTLTSSATPVVLVQTYYKVKVRVFNKDVSAVTGNLTTTGTFGTFSQFIQLRPAKPTGVAKITPSGTSPCSSNSAAYGPNPAPTAPNNKVCNTISTNTLEFQLTNNGNTGNNIKQIRINLPDSISTVPAVSVNVTQGSESFSFTGISHPAKVTFTGTAGSKNLLLALDGIAGGAASAGLLGNSGPKNSVVVTFSLTDTIASLSGDTSVAFSGYIENGNGDLLTDNSFGNDPSGVQSITWTNPYARGKAEVLRASTFNYVITNPTGDRELYNTSSNDTVRLTYKIFNPSTTEDTTNTDNGWYAVEVTVPAGFGAIANVTSAKGGTVAVAGNVIRIDYATQIAPGDQEQISFDATETFYNNFSAHDFTSRVSNLLSPANFNFPNGYAVGSVTPGSREMTFVYQPVSALAYTEVCHNTPAGTRCSTAEASDNENNPLLLDISLTEDLIKNNVIRYYVKNTGIAGAHLKKIRIYPRKNSDGTWTIAGADAIDASYISATNAFSNVTGSKNGSTAGISCTNDVTYASKFIECDFSGAGSGIDTGDIAYIQFELRHTTNMPANQYLALRARATNDLSPAVFKPDTTAQSHISAATSAQMASPTYPEGSTESIKIQVSKPAGSAQGFLTLTNQTNSAPYDGINAIRTRSVVNNVTAYYYLKNTGVGTNRIYKARVAIPATWTGKVTVTPNTLDRSAGVTISGGYINVDYDPADNGSTYLNTLVNNTDRIQITLAHDISTEDNSQWALQVTNDAPPDSIVYDAGTVTSAKSDRLLVLLPPKMRITSSQDQNSTTPGNPVQLYTTNTLPQTILRISNQSALKGIRRARIVVPDNTVDGFLVSAISSSVLGAITPPVYPVVNADLNYATPLAAGNLDDITITFKRNPAGDPFTPATHNWAVYIVYDDGTTDSQVLIAENSSGTGGDLFNVSDSLLAGASLTTEFILPPLPIQAYLNNNTTVFNNRANHMGLNFPGWGNLDGNASPAGDTLNTSLDDGGISFTIVNNSSISGNDIRYVKITAPTALVSDLSKSGTDIETRFDPTGANTLLTQTTDATCSAFAQDYCIKTGGALANELVLVFKQGVATVSKEVRIKTVFTKEATLLTTQNAAFTVQASNDPAGANLQTATTPIAEGGTNYSRSLTLFYYNPSHLTERYVEKKESTAGESGNPNMLYKTETDHKILLYIRNSGHSAGRIYSFTISIPPNVFALKAGSLLALKNASDTTLTGGVNYTCAVGCNHATGAITAGTFTINLAGANEITANSFIKAELLNFDTSATADSGGNPYPTDDASAVANDRFGVTSYVNTAYTQAVSSSVLTGKTDFIQLKRPQPSAVAFIHPDDTQLETTGGVNLINLQKVDAPPADYVEAGETGTYTVTAQYKRKIRLIVENTGSGNNTILQMKIRIPDEFNRAVSPIVVAPTAPQIRTDQTAPSYTNSATASATTATGVSGNEITIDFTTFNTSSAARSIITIPVDMNLLNLPATQQWQIIVKNNLAALDCFTGNTEGCTLIPAKSGQTLAHSFVFPAAGLEYEVTSGSKVYSVNTATNTIPYSGTLKVMVRARGNPLKYAAFQLPKDLGGAGLPVFGAITSENSATVSSHNGGAILGLDYGAGLAANTTDTINIPLSGNIPRDTAASLSIVGRYIDSSLVSISPFDTNCGTPAAVAADLQAGTTLCLQPVIPSGKAATYEIVRAPFANLKGTILPIKDVLENNVTITVSVQNSAGTIINDFNGNPLVALSNPGSGGAFSFIGSPSTIKAGTATDGAGIPLCTDASGTTCDNTREFYLRFSANGFNTKVVPYTLTRSLETAGIAFGELEIESFKPQSGKENLAVARDGSNNKCAQVNIPDNGISETFALQIECLQLSQVVARTASLDVKNASALSAASGAGKDKLGVPALPDQLPLYLFTIKDGKGTELENIDLFYRNSAQNKSFTSVESTITVYYDSTAMNTQGYNESKLALFTFDPYRKVWVKVGGKVNTASKTVTAQIASLNRYYTVAQSDSSGGAISDVVVTPRIFTPGQGDRHFNRMTLQFTLNGNPEKYEVGIFDISGKLITLIEKSGTLGAGQIFWDGYDTQGNLVRGGIYVYVIRAGGEKYRGTIVVTR